MKRVIKNNLYRQKGLVKLIFIIIMGIIILSYLNIKADNVVNNGYIQKIWELFKSFWG